MENVKGYELVVYGANDEEGGEPALTRTFRSPVFSWTPSLDQCLEKGSLYAWSVRALRPENASEWSEARLFRVVGEPDEREVEEAFEVVRRYLAHRGNEISGTDLKSDTDRRQEARSRTTASDRFTAFKTSVARALTVEGEVRTVGSSDAPRLWGRGRPGTTVFLEEGAVPPSLCENGDIQFGLSLSVVERASAADACAAESWFCTLAERGNGCCDTYWMLTTASIAMDRSGI